MTGFVQRRLKHTLSAELWSNPESFRNAAAYGHVLAH
jgi:hypothetical protein